MNDITHLTFRAYPADEEDQCKSVIRIDRKYMQQLNIKEGDVIRLEGNTKSAAAVCLALEDKNYVTDKNAKIYDIDIEYKNKDNSNQDPYPKIRINNL